MIVDSLSLFAEHQPDCMALRIAFSLVLLQMAPAFRILKKRTHATSGQKPQYTPDQANWTYPYFTDSDFNSLERLPWNGQKLNAADPALHRKLCGVSGKTLLGIHDLYGRVNPFRGVLSPSKADVDDWNRQVINHIRALFGYRDRNVTPDHCVFAQAQWGEERFHRTKWNNYPAIPDLKAAGPCPPGSDSHCGSTFLPNAQDQKPYLPPGHKTCDKWDSRTEGIYGHDLRVGWQMKLAQAYCDVIRHEGFCGGHAGPFLRRKTFGLAFWTDGRVRGKWGGFPLWPLVECGQHNR